MKGKLVLIASTGILIGIITGITIKNMPAGITLGMIIGIVSCLFTSIVSKS